MKLIKLSDYIDELFELLQSGEISETTFIDKTIRYKMFKAQNLLERYEINGVSAHPLNRFIETDEEGNVLSESDFYQKGCNKNEHTEFMRLREQFQEAKERVLFTSEILRELSNEDIIIEVRMMRATCETVEDLIPYDLTLTESALNGY